MFLDNISSTLPILAQLSRKLKHWIKCCNFETTFATVIGFYFQLTSHNMTLILATGWYQPFGEEVPRGKLSALARYKWKLFRRSLSNLSESQQCRCCCWKLSKITLKPRFGQRSVRLKISQEIIKSPSIQTFVFCLSAAKVLCLFSFMINQQQTGSRKESSFLYRAKLYGSLKPDTNSLIWTHFSLVDPTEGKLFQQSQKCQSINTETTSSINTLNNS